MNCRTVVVQIVYIVKEAIGASLNSEFLLLQGDIYSSLNTPNPTPQRHIPEVLERHPPGPLRVHSHREVPVGRQFYGESQPLALQISRTSPW